MKERPILFNGQMVRAILEGRKTQTRRIWKMPSWAEWDLMDGGEERGAIIPKNQKHRGWYSLDEVQSPYGREGDKLWVREAWRIGAWDEHNGCVAVDYRADDFCRREWINIAYGDEGEEFNRYWQQSTDDAIKVFGHRDRYEWKQGQSPCRWRPSIHMPRWASRILLEITGVRVERLQDISREDAIAEGTAWDKCPTHQTVESIQAQRDAHAIGMCAHYVAEIDYIGGFHHLWESINGPGSWDKNPWVWVIEFKRI